MTKHLTHFIKHNYHPELRHTGIGPLPHRHTGAGRYPLQATQPPQKRAVQKIPLSVGNMQCRGGLNPTPVIPAQAGIHCVFPPHVIPWLDHGTQVYAFFYFNTKQKKSRQIGGIITLLSAFYNKVYQFLWYNNCFYNLRIAQFCPRRSFCRRNNCTFACICWHDKFCHTFTIY